MKRVVLECAGRLANLIMCWANAYHVLRQMGLDDRQIVLNYDMPAGRVTFPGAVVQTTCVDSLPRVTRHQIKDAGDCLWLWPDVFTSVPVSDQIVRMIELSTEFSNELERTVGTRKTVGIHVRYGDYAKEPGPGAPFVRASQHYFLDCIAACLMVDPATKFYLASDGTPEELEFLTSKFAWLSNLILGRRDDPVFDLFALSRCRLIIGSNSTFTAVAQAYGNVPVIVPSMLPGDIQQTIDKWIR